MEESMINDLLQKMELLNTSIGYITGEDTIQDLIQKINNAIEPIDKEPNTYINKSTNCLARIDLTIKILSAKKFKDNREDALILLNFLRENINQLEKVIKEVEVDVTTSE